MGKRLYVGNLPYSVTEDDLTEKFSAHGTVESAKIISDRNTGRSKGFGFVEMPKAGDAKAAVFYLNGKELDGAVLRVKRAT